MGIFHAIGKLVFKNQQSKSRQRNAQIKATAVPMTLLLQEARYCRNVSENDRRAIKLCDRMLAQDPNHRDALLIKAGALGSLGRQSESLQLIRRIMQKWPNHWEAHYLLGLRLFNEDEQAAMQALQKSLGLEERFDNLVVTAQLAYFMGHLDYQEYLEKAELLDPPRFHNYMKTCWSYDG